MENNKQQLFPFFLEKWQETRGGTCTQAKWEEEWTDSKVYIVYMDQTPNIVSFYGGIAAAVVQMSTFATKTVYTSQLETRENCEQAGRQNPITREFCSIYNISLFTNSLGRSKK